MPFWKRPAKGSTATRNCDKCGSSVTSPDGYLLDPRKEDLEKWHALTKFAGLALKAGAVGVTPQSDPVWFVCEACVARLGVAEGGPADPALKVMSSARAIHFWNTGDWERPMLAQEFPPESEESRLPWMNLALEAEWRKKVGREPALEDHLATRAAILGRCLVQSAHQASMPNNPCAAKPQRLAVVVAEMDVGWSWDKCLLGFIERRLLARVGATTKVWFISYRDAADSWFTHRMLPYVAASIPAALDQSAAELEFACYVDNHGRRYLAVFG